jgi:hypothetical protein
MDFVMKILCVACEVETEFLYITLKNSKFRAVKPHRHFCRVTTDVSDCRRDDRAPGSTACRVMGPAEPLIPGTYGGTKAAGEWSDIYPPNLE